MNERFLQMVMQFDYKFDEVYNLLDEKGKEDFNKNLRTSVFSSNGLLFANSGLSVKHRDSLAQTYLFRNISPANLENAIAMVKEERYEKPCMTAESLFDNKNVSIRLWADRPQAISGHLDWSYKPNYTIGLFEANGTQKDEERLVSNGIVRLIEDIQTKVHYAYKVRRAVRIYHLV